MMTMHLPVGTVLPVPRQVLDAVDRITGQWNAVRPDVDVSPIQVIGRVSRLSRLVDTSTRDRRMVVVRLPAQGLDLVDEVVHAHLATEREILAALSPRQQRELARLLRTALLSLGDRAADRAGDRDVQS
jgi:hypothetical protein